ncbi:MAG TPA: hypothetical protein VI759_07315 [Dehalococcoidia bacterium]|nr:hypothetical protein [Dehalococcoidia bacterium]
MIAKSGAISARIVQKQVHAWKKLEDGRLGKGSLRIEATVMCGAPCGPGGEQICRGELGEIVMLWSIDATSVGDRPLHMPKSIFQREDGVWRPSKHAQRRGRAPLPRRASKMEWNPQDSLERGKMHGPGATLTFKGDPNWRDKFWAHLPSTIECPQCHKEQDAPASLLDDIVSAMRTWSQTE